MYFHYDRRFKLLHVDDDFAHLRTIHDNGDVDFVFYYTVSPSSAVQRRALSVNVSTFSKTVNRPTLLPGSLDTKALVDNIRSQVTNAKSAVKQQEGFIVAAKRSDITAKINNEIVGQLRAGVNPSDIQQLRKTRLKVVSVGSIKDRAEVRPVLNVLAHSSITDVVSVNSASLDIDTKVVMHDMIVRQGIDPSHIAQLTPRSITATDSIQGTLRPSRMRDVEYSPLSLVMNHHLFPAQSQVRPNDTTQLSDSSRVEILVSEVEENVEVPVVITLPRFARRLDGDDNYHFFVKFDLIASDTGLAIDTVIKQLDVARHFQLYNTPKLPPIVTVTRSEVSSRANLEIKQVDPRAVAVKVFQKQISRAVVGSEDYVFVGTFPVKSEQQSLLVQVDDPQSSTVIYRVVPVGAQGTDGFEFTNVVLNPKRYQPINALSLTAYAVDTGMKIEARHIPPTVVAIEFLVRNMTTYESGYTNVGGDLQLIDDSIRTIDHVSVIDNNVKSGNIYEYVARLVHRSGTSSLAGNVTIEFIDPTPGKVDTRIENLVVDQLNDANVTFTVATNVIDTGIDVVKTLLQRQDIYELFKNDVLREREFLKSLIAHSVQRVDLTTGVRDDFGIITTSNFNDRDLRKNQAIDPLKLGHRYRYEVTALLRSPETMFESLKKEGIDPTTKKSFRFNPAKFMHPIALKRGNIVTSAGLRTRYSKEAMSHGALGTVVSFEVSFDQEQASIVDASVSRFDRFTNVLAWKVNGSIDQVDHFLIMKDQDGVRTVVGKVHSEFEYGNCQYVHSLEGRDSGSFSYVIVPVFNDYHTGTSVATNAVTV